MTAPSTRRAKSSRYRYSFFVLAGLLAALFVRLGFWQLDRLDERRTLNELRRTRLALPSMDFPPTGREGETSAPKLPPVDDVLWRRVLLRGRYDFAREIILPGRPYQGRPGVEILTPLLVREELAVLVLRGWLPATDALHAPLRTARPGFSVAAVESSTQVEGIALPSVGPPRSIVGLSWPQSGEPSPRLTIDGELHHLLARADLQIASDILPYPIAKFYLKMDDMGASMGPLRPRSLPSITDGSHLSYAIQWFAFAVIALVGTAVYMRRGR